MGFKVEPFDPNRGSSRDSNRGDPLPLSERWWLSVAEVSAITGYTKPLIYMEMSQGSLRSYTRGGRGQVRIHRDDLDAWMRGEAPPEAGRTAPEVEGA